MDATSKVNETAVRIKRPAETAGELFAVERPADAQPVTDDAQRLTDEMLASIDAGAEAALLEAIPNAEDFEESVRKALEAVGGELLFQMRLENVEDCRHVAAISLGSGDDRRLALVILPPEGAMRIEAAESSTNPIAGIARSYVGLVEAYKAAA